MTPERRRAYQRKYRRTHRAHLRELKRQWKAANQARLNETNAAYRARNREGLKAYHRAWYAKNKKRVAKRHRAWRERHPERWQAIRKVAARRANLARYGLTVAQYEALLAAQDGRCAICRRPEWKVQRGQVRRLSVDHAHGGMAVRGLLCHRCNSVLGLVEDDVALLEAASHYLHGVAV